MGYAFDTIANSKCDSFLVMDFILTSNMVYEIYKRQNWGYLCCLSSSILDYAEYNEHFNWKKTKFKGKGDDGYVAWWTGAVLACFQWAYKIDFKEWIKYMSSEDVYNMYYPLHEASFTKAVEVVKYNYDHRVKDNKKRNNLKIPNHFVEYFDKLRVDLNNKLVHNYGKDSDYWDDKIFSTDYIKNMILPAQPVNFDNTDTAYTKVVKQLRELKVIKD